MKNIEKYYDKTKSDKPRNNVEQFIKQIKYNPGKATELGCGAGNDTVYLIKKGWNVLAIDKENVKERITSRLNKDEKEKFRFQQQNFENIKLERSNLIIANNCLSFCNKNKFKELWNKIKENISEEGYFIGNFFGIKDSWKETKTDMTFFIKEEIKELFKDFEIIQYKEIEKDALTGLGKIKHWHIFDVTARKRKE